MLSTVYSIYKGCQGKHKADLLSRQVLISTVTSLIWIASKHTHTHMLINASKDSWPRLLCIMYKPVWPKNSVCLKTYFICYPRLSNKKKRRCQHCFLAQQNITFSPKSHIMVFELMCLLFFCSVGQWFPTFLVWGTPTLLSDELTYVVINL